MRVLLASIALPLLLSLAAPVAAQHHAHARTAPAPATRWATDPALRAGMGRIRDAASRLPHDARGHLGPAQLAALAAGVERDVALIVSHCKLAPAADAALHPILGELVKGAQSLKADPPDAAAASATIDAALADYARRFDDPGFAGAVAGHPAH